MTPPTTGSLRVPGATLHYEVRGQGPLLLLIPGGAGDAASYDGIADDLAATRTVAAYDPRGLSRSPLDDPGARQRVADHAEDALRLLEHLSPGEPAQVFGASSGAVTALHLLTAHPERVARAVVHEPPVVEVLPDAATQREFLARVQHTLRTEGLGPAMAEFAAGLTADGAPPPAAAVELPPQAAARAERTRANLPYFLGRIVPGFMAYSPDLERLAGVADRLVTACGADSTGELPQRAVTFLAQRLGTPLAEFPGGHIGLTTHPDAFRTRLVEALEDRT
ncbi:alpha/beta fold hydrolase [Streptomyces sp. NPDC058045]|uniref:alpha/beta fold hydrolase n=1 Tax=Streptomyces sp. NPDC058045 TaxID=3346311 RepID=UPI0036E23746